MARTHIISGDGTIFVELSASRRRRNKIIAAISLIAATPFAAAAAVGIYLGATGQVDSHTPTITAEPVATAGIPLAKAQKACRPAPKGMRPDCLALYMRSAWTTPHSFTPAGPALVTECLDQYRGTELRLCLEHPIG